ncbi:MAG: hypothetical protein Q8Q09_00660 [Deltaproteobacteria bacterium]|nr:hypothetical protein [Deltaproteobacteria bacterium]
MTVTLRGLDVDPVEQAAVTVMMGAVGAHVGLYYLADDDGTRRHIHLAFHYQLLDEVRPPPDAVWVSPKLRPDELSDVATAARLVARRHRDGRVPYALAKRDAQLTDEGLALGTSVGLTCATFVLVLFERAHIALMDESTWESGRTEARIAQDQAAQRKLVDYLEKRDGAHAKKVAAEVGCTRFRGEEVAAASGLPDHPVPFAVAELAGKQVLTDLQPA